MPGKISFFQSQLAGTGGFYLTDLTNELDYNGDLVFSKDGASLVGLAYLETLESDRPNTSSRRYSARRGAENSLTLPPVTHSTRLGVVPSTYIIDFLRANHIQSSPS